jgi:hypothetical protein
MANKRPRRKPRAASDEDASATTPGASKGRSWPPGSSPAEGPPGPRRDIRPFLYAGFDFAMAGVYALLMIQAPTRHPAHAALLWGTVVAVALAGVGMLWRSRWGWRAAVTGCTALLAIAVVVLVLILLSASFLSGVYGSMGRGAAMMALLAGALVIEVCGLLPAFQLKFLFTRAGRRLYGQPIAEAK